MKLLKKTIDYGKLNTKSGTSDFIDKDYHISTILLWKIRIEIHFVLDIEIFHLLMAK